MATIDWPPALHPQTFSAGLRKSGLQFRSPLNGSMQAVSFVAERWVFSLALRPRRLSNSDVGLTEALLNRLSGGIERVRCHHFARPQPRGTMRGTPTLATAASRGNASLSVTGYSGGASLNLFQSTKAFDDAYWTKNGATVSANSATAPDGTLTADKIVEATGTSQHRVYRGVSVVSGTTYTLSVHAKAGERSVLFLNGPDTQFDNPSHAVFNLATGAFQTSGGTATMTALSDGWYRCTWTKAAIATATAEMQFLLSPVYDIAFANTTYAGDGASGLYLWGAQFEVGSGTAYAQGTTLKAGDMLGCGGQLFQVESDCDDEGTGTMTVPVINRVRSAIAQGTAVTWDRPTAEFICPAMVGMVAFRPNVLEGVPFDLEEVW